MVFTNLFKYFFRQVSWCFFPLLLTYAPLYGQIAINPPRSPVSVSQRQFTRFAQDLDSLRVGLKIPGLAAALLEGDSLVWSQGFGYSDLEHGIKTTPQTTFRIASLTKTFTATLILQLVEAGKLHLDTLVSRYGVALDRPDITVKHLLTNTSEGEPGTHFQYNGYLFGRLGPVVEQVAGMPFYQLLFERILLPLQLSSTAPDVPLYDYFTYTQARPEVSGYFTNAFSRLAKPYALTDSGSLVRDRYNHEFGAFGGLLSSVTDLGKYSAALDRNQLVTAKSQQLIFTPNRTRDGQPTPYGLGWFTQTYKGQTLLWAYGQSRCESALLVKVPAQKLTLVVLANSDKMSVPFPMGDGDMLMSPVGQLFYKTFMNTRLPLVDYQLAPAQLAKQLGLKNGDRDFYSRELIIQATLAHLNRNPARARELYQLYANLVFPEPSAPTQRALAQIAQVANNSDSIQPFTLAKTTKVRIVGVGENCSGDFKEWCDYGWIEQAGKVIWEMKAKPATAAGGALKNQQVEAILTLPAGSYQLRYHSDYAHAYDQWDALPPTHFTYGISLYVLE